VRILDGSVEVARHIRTYDRHQLVLDPAHREAVLQIKRKERFGVTLLESFESALGTPPSPNISHKICFSALCTPATSSTHQLRAHILPQVW
jgi:hypothetical protein